MSRAGLTHMCVDIRNADDVLVVLEAVRLGILPLIKLRLSASEREELRSGNVFVWEESHEEGGLLRWTDGRRWSQSKVFAECLLYEEKADETEEEKEAKARRRAQRICNPGASILPPRRNQRPSKSGGLTKQTYSLLVRLPGTSQARKWHIVAYTSWMERASLPVIDDYPALRDIQIPVGIFERTKATDTVNIHFAERPGKSDREIARGEMRPMTHPQKRLQTDRRSTPNERDPTHESKLPSFGPGRDDGTDIVLPTMSSLNSCWNLAHTFPEASLHTLSRDPISQEDRRILNSFRLGL
ncbi:Gti1/Pac2 family-domain-containing protein [Mycena maculata]|uniref:Gti1/Pac2 family-domain-containing protein n=1 Tax=Mycena maculata TaxID=230809 RepID=A0AAD7MQC0_9AGAR|nr:Gti1/Pac2 family-domain-containing protein [Mycena maculata]